MRPRANTISHVDVTTLGMIAAADSSAPHLDGNSIGLNRGTHGLPGVGSHHFRGMSTATGHHGNPHVLPRLETKNSHVDASASLRTAPPYVGFGAEVDMENLWFGPGSTINPAQLHFSNSPQTFAFDTISSPYHQGFPSVPATQDPMGRDFAWLNSFDHQMSFDHANEQAIDGSSPSAMSGGSPEGMGDMVLDGFNNPLTTSTPWQNPMIAPASLPPDCSMDLTGPTFPDLYPTGHLSPRSLNAYSGNNDHYFSTPPLSSPQAPLQMFQGTGHHYFHPPLAANPDTPSNSAASISSSNRHSSVTSVSTDSITDATRQALLTSLSQPLMYGQNHPKTTQPQVSSPLSPGIPGQSRSMSSVPLPSTFDLQRYVAAYIQYYHPHLPFLHIPSLSFDSPAFTSILRVCSGHFAFGQSGVSGGGGSLILAMAAIGALFEYDMATSKDLFDMAKRMIQLYLQERRKADMSAAPNSTQGVTDAAAQNTPLWLVQAMLLNVIYGHNCGDKTAAKTANTHCAALVSLARAADLVKPLAEYPVDHEPFQRQNQEDVQMGENDTNAGLWSNSSTYAMLDTQNEWHSWKLAEERKRTLYAVFILSSLRVSAYNHPPALMNSEIRHNLPCDEALWAVDSAETWRALGGGAVAEKQTTSFASALSSLLSSSQRLQQGQQHMSQPTDQSNFKFEDLPESDLKPSTFGCLVLIHAMHNYMWETRQRHIGTQWTTQETEVMHARMKPALRAWQAAWSSNPEHSLERPNPFGASSLSADCIPLLDLAYVRLFVNLGRSKEAFFRRDFDAMAVELAHGAEIVQHANHSLSSSPGNGTSTVVSSTEGNSPEGDAQQNARSTSSVKQELVSDPNTGQYSKRERHLRKAAFCAMRSLTLSDKLGVTFADFNSRELPLQSALCAFDCAQVLAEWISTVQERVGRYLGILGRDKIDFCQVPAIMLLEEDDCKLMEQINNILANGEMKLANSGNMDAVTALTATHGPDKEGCGYGSKLLLLHARMYEKDSCWPRKFLMYLVH